MAHEVELKLRITPADAPLLRHHPALHGALSGRPVTRKLTSIYYDTPQLTLLDAAISLRVRRMAGGWFQAVKGAGSSLSGLHQRMEWEDIIAAGHPDFSKITEPALTRIFDDEALRAALVPIFITDVRRTEWQLVYADGTHIEVALDLGQLKVGDLSEPISEVELELKQGHPGRLFDLALTLQHDIPLWLENVSKAQRGYAHYRPSPPQVAKARPPALEPGLPARIAFKKIAWECLSQLQGNQDMVLHGNDIEGVHQMRVALRRLRSATSVFQNQLEQEALPELLAELRWITNVLGCARDLDVFLSQTLPPLLTQFDDHAGLLALREKAASAQKKAYRDVRHAIESQRYQRLLLALGAWLEGAQMEGDGTGDVLSVARVTLHKRHLQLKKHGRRLHAMKPEERHATRIAGKKLRYAAEFFAGLYPQRKMKPFINSLTQLQDTLGAVNDIAVTEQLLNRLAGRHPDPAIQEARALLRGWNSCNARHLLAQVTKIWRKFAAHKSFWK